MRSLRDAPSQEWQPSSSATRDQYLPHGTDTSIRRLVVLQLLLQKDYSSFPDAVVIFRENRAC